jgi:hypothetical protein
MSRVTDLNSRYASAASLLADGIEIVAVGDPQGARLNDIVNRLLKLAAHDDLDVWADIIGAAKLVRWRRLTQAQPPPLNAAMRQSAEQLRVQARRLTGSVSDGALLLDCEAVAEELLENAAPMGAVLLQSLEEVGPGCGVITADNASRAALAEWIDSGRFPVMTANELEKKRPPLDQLYVVGPPRFFRSSLITAPLAPGLTFILPSWFRDRALPRSPLANYAEGSARVPVKIHSVGIEGPAPGHDEAAASEEDLEQFLPQPVWGSPRHGGREPGSDEVEARKLLLAGARAIWLDDGERIRGLDPAQPLGERVTYIDVEHVTVGSYLLLRQGETEREALVSEAFMILGSRASAIAATQQDWKSRLQSKIFRMGRPAVVRELRRLGVQTPERAYAWTSPQLVRPHSDTDFEHLLRWLQLPLQPTFSHAILLRRALYQASANLREELENAMSSADIDQLEREGHLSIDASVQGLRGLLATRVVAIAPYTEIIPRSDARLPFTDRTGQWLA